MTKTLDLSILIPNFYRKIHQKKFWNFQIRYKIFVHLNIKSVQKIQKLWKITKFRRPKKPICCNKNDFFPLISLKHNFFSKLPIKNHLSIAVRAMGLDDNYHHRMLDENIALIETPLVGPLNSHIRQHFKTALYPYNITTASGSAANSFSIDDGDGNGNGISSYEKSRYPTQELHKEVIISYSQKKIIEIKKNLSKLNNLMSTK